MKKCKDKNKTKHKNVDDFQTFTELLKSKHKKHKVYNAKSNDFEIFNNNKKDENEKSENIATLLKNIVSKISEFNWVANSDVFSYMINQLWFFNDFLIYIKRCIIKVKERKLYVNHCDTVIMQNHYENSVKLSFVFHVFKLKINFLFKRKIYKKDL